MLLMPPTRARLTFSKDDLTGLKQEVAKMADKLRVSRVALKRHLANINEIDNNELDFLLGSQSHEL